LPIFVVLKQSCEQQAAERFLDTGADKHNSSFHDFALAASSEIFVSVDPLCVVSCRVRGAASFEAA
jgi:hypothetical protein